MEGVVVPINTWQEVALVALNVAQTIALAYIASRSNRVRRGDRGSS